MSEFLRPEHLFAAASGLLLGVGWARWRRRRRMAHSRRIGRTAERRAVRMLRRAGYRVVALQPSARVVVEVDGAAQSFLVRGDLLVRRRRRTYLAEIKGGDESASVAHRATRRQLLEYASAFSVDGILLVSVRERRIQRVVFPA
ncbi:MAG: hypothetical protein ACYTGZ_12595 [Planctomycetota bacterium]